MGAAIPQVASAAEDRASGAQVIDGSLRFNQGLQNSAYANYFKRTLSSDGNRRTYTISAWCKRTWFCDMPLGNGYNVADFALCGTNDFRLFFDNANNGNVLRAYDATFGNTLVLMTNHQYRDTGWYHVVLAVDTTQGTAANRAKLYVNGEQLKWFSGATYPDQNSQGDWNDASYVHYLGQIGTGRIFDGHISQFYNIDGQQLGPESFGFTDPLTGTWRPKKFSGTYSGEYPLADYTGGLPILATNSLGTAVTSGTRADSNSANIVLAVPFNGNVTDYSATIKGSGSALVGSTDSITYPTTNDKYYGSSVYQNHDGDVAWYITGESAFTIGTGAFTVECWVRNDGNHDGAGGANEDQYVWHFTDISMRLRMWKPSGGSRIITFYTADITNEPTVATVLDNEWHHIAVVREGTGSNQFKIYVDGALSYTGTDGTNLSGDKFMVGNYSTSADYGFSGNIQDIRVYNAAKYTSAFTVPPDRNLAAGTNSFYLPMDGNSPIGRDKSGKGNDYTPINFGCSNNISKATGALPIFNTVSGGRVASAGVRTDTFGNSCVLALPLLSNSLDVSNQINSGTTAKAITENGNSAASSTQSNLYGGSYYLDGTGDWLVNSSSTSDFSFGTGDFTVECWAYWTGSSEEGVFQLSTNANGMNPGNTNTVSLRMDNVWTAYLNDGNHSFSTGATLNTWYHLALVRNSGTTKLFVNGVQDPTAVTDTRDYSMTYCAVGGNSSSSYVWTGYIQDFRVYKGAAKYTNDFIPPSTHPDVVPDSPSGVAYSSELTKTTSGAVAFDGTDDFLRISTSSDFDQNAGTDFTAECFFYMTAASGPSHIFGFQIDANNRTSLYFTSNSTTLNWWTSLSGSNGNRVSVSNVSLNAWHHVAITRSGSTTTMWFDGISQGTSTTTDYPNGSQLLDIGTYNGSGYNPDDFPGFISNVRYVKGTAVYTANFAPPTSPLTNITNTKLLCCQGSSSSNASVSPTATALLNVPLSSTPFADSSSTGATITNVGSIAVASAGTNNFNIANGASLNGSSQRISTNNTNMSFTGSWTLDAWFKLDSSASGYNALFNTGYGSQTSNYMYFGINDDEKPYVEGGSAGGSTTAANAINKNQWYQMRVRSDGLAIKQYIDGELVVTHGVNTTDMSSLGTKTIGSLLDNGNNANNFHGLVGPVRYVSSDLGPPPAGGLSGDGATVSNTPAYGISTGGSAKASTFNPFDTDIDTVTGKSGQYCTWNPLWKNSTQTNGDKVPVLRNGDLDVVFASGDSTNTFKSVCGTIAIDSTKGGKWYYETSSAGGIYNQIGMCREDYLWQVNKDGWGIAGSGMGLTFSSGGNWSINKGSLWTNLTTWSTYGQLVSFLIDFDNNTVNAWVDGIEVAYTVDISSYVKDWAPFWYPMISLGYNTGNCTNDETSRSNFGQRPFKFTPPEGYQPICEANMSSPGTTNLPDKYFTTFSYNGSSATTFRKLGLEADLVWIKSNYDNVGGWNCLDTVRGASQTILLNDSTAQTNETGNFDSFNKEGVTVKGSANAWNGIGDKFVIYAWAAGGSKGTFNKDGKAYSTAATAGLTAGDITPTGSSINTKTGFSIIQYTSAGDGDRVPHGLNETPSILFTKVVSEGSQNWSIYTTQVDGSYDYFRLNGTNAKGDSGQTPFNSTTFPNIHGSGKTVINYLWHNVPGVQKFGRFTGTNAADGPFVYLGFQPAVVILKETGGSAWTIKCNNAFTNVSDSLSNDNYGGNFNPVTNQMYLNTTAIDEAKSNEYGKLDFLSNGFKPRIAGQSVNSAADYIYMAWAAEPFHNLYGGSATAR